MHHTHAITHLLFLRSLFPNLKLSQLKHDILLSHNSLYKAPSPQSSDTVPLSCFPTFRKITVPSFSVLGSPIRSHWTASHRRRLEAYWRFSAYAPW